MLLYSEKIQSFTTAHPCENVTVDGAQFRYILSGKTDGKTLVFLNGGMNTLGMWMDYVDGLSDVCRVLLFDYPQELRTNQELVVGMHAFFQKFGIKDPIFIGASDGGMVAQIYTQKYPDEVGGLILISTGGMDANTLKSLKRKYRFALLMLWYLKRCNYEKMKPKLIKLGMSHIRNESAEEVAYAQDMFDTIFRDYQQEKDVHISGLLADLMNQIPVTASDFAAVQGKILLILPNQDFFPENAGRSYQADARSENRLCFRRASFHRAESRRLCKNDSQFSKRNERISTFRDTNRGGKDHDYPAIAALLFAVHRNGKAFRNRRSDQWAVFLSQRGTGSCHCIGNDRPGDCEPKTKMVHDGVLPGDVYCTCIDYWCVEWCFCFWHSVLAGTAVSRSDEYL